MLFVEHEPVVTFGRGAKPAHLLVAPAYLERRGVDFFETARGGDVTLHAPGQLVGYPILDLSPDRRDVRRFVSDLTECMRRTAKDFGVDSGPSESYVGLWADAETPTCFRGRNQDGDLRKLGAIGVRISRWVTMHGFALNLDVDLSLFDLIVPCGIRGGRVTSLKQLTGRAPSVSEAAERALLHFSDIFETKKAKLEDGSPWLV